MSFRTKAFNRRKPPTTLITLPPKQVKVRRSKSKSRIRCPMISYVSNIACGIECRLSLNQVTLSSNPRSHLWTCLLSKNSSFRLPFQKKIDCLKTSPKRGTNMVMKALNEYHVEMRKYILKKPQRFFKGKNGIWNVIGGHFCAWKFTKPWKESIKSLLNILFTRL